MCPSYMANKDCQCLPKAQQGSGASCQFAVDCVRQSPAALVAQW